MLPYPNGNEQEGGGSWKVFIFILDWTGFWENVCIFKVDLRDKKKRKKKIGGSIVS